MKRFIILVTTLVMMLGLSAQYHKTMRVWKDGVSTNYITTYEFDSITFSTELADFQLSHDFITLRAEQTIRLKPNMPVDKWESSNEAIAVVNNGWVTGIAEGYVAITATSKGNTKTCVVQVLKKSFFTEDGCYILGEASPIKDETDSNAILAQMAQGINEAVMNDGLSWEESKREGMWEKYIWLEANKEFELILKEGDNLTHLGAQLSQQQLYTDGPNMLGYKGYIGVDQKMKVAETGFYHIVVDFNRDYKFDRPQIIVVPAAWGVTGDMNGWGITEGEVNVVSTKEIIWRWENQVIETGTGRLRFKDAKSSWKIILDESYQVKAHTNLGENGRNGGEDIVIEERGIYTIKLVYNLAAGDIENSYSYEIIKTEELPEIDPSTTYVYSFIGTVNGNWDTDTDFAFVSRNDNHYVFEANNLDFPAGEFKIRVNHDWGKNFGYCSLTVYGLEVSGSDNIVTSTPFKGSARFEFDWNGWSEENIVLTFYPQ